MFLVTIFLLVRLCQSCRPLDSDVWVTFRKYRSIDGMTGQLRLLLFRLPRVFICISKISPVKVTVVQVPRFFVLPPWLKDRTTVRIHARKHEGRIISAFGPWLKVMLVGTIPLTCLRARFTDGVLGRTRFGPAAHLCSGEGVDCSMVFWTTSVLESQNQRQFACAAVPRPSVSPCVGFFNNYDTCWRRVLL